MSWRDELGELMVQYYRADQRVKRDQGRKAELKLKILGIMKTREIKQIILNGLEATWIPKRVLPRDLSLLQRVIGDYWWPRVTTMVPRPDRALIESLAEKGKIDKVRLEAVLEDQDTLKVEKAKRRKV